VLNNEGIGHRTPRDKLIELGHKICATLSDGVNPLKAAQDLYDAADPSQHDAGTLVGAAIGAYCPQYSSELEK
jgi:hypothetical protein